MRKHLDFGMLIEVADRLNAGADSGVAALMVWSRDDPRNNGGVAISYVDGVISGLVRICPREGVGRA